MNSNLTNISFPHVYKFIFKDFQFQNVVNTSDCLKLFVPSKLPFGSLTILSLAGFFSLADSLFVTFSLSFITKSAYK